MGGVSGTGGEALSVWGYWGLEGSIAMLGVRLGDVFSIGLSTREYRVTLAGTSEGDIGRWSEGRSSGGGTAVRAFGSGSSWGSCSGVLKLDGEEVAVVTGGALSERR